MHGFVLNLEIVVSVEEKTAKYSAMIADNVGYDVIKFRIIQQGKNAEIYSCIDTANAAIQNEIAVFLEQM